MAEGMTLVFTTLFVAVVLFLLFRGLTLWYWRINDLHAELVKLNDRMESVHTRLIGINEVVARRDGAG
jgi:hypothetical protein